MALRPRSSASTSRSLSLFFFPFLFLLPVGGFFENALPKAKSLSREEDDELLLKEKMLRRRRSLEFCGFVRLSEDEVKNDFTPDEDGGPDFCCEMSIYDEDEEVEYGSLVRTSAGEPRFF